MTSLALSPKNRLSYFDIYRGFGILLMVMGHIGFGKTFDFYIHAFHMPLFFLVSGYFTNPEKDKMFLPFIGHAARTLLVPYLVFAVLLCQPLHYLYTHEWSWKYMLLSLATSNHNRIDVAGAYWFLLCLFSCKVLFWCVLRIEKALLQACTVIVLTLVGMLEVYRFPLCFDSAMSMLCIMYIGYLARKHQNKTMVAKVINQSWWSAIAMVLLGGVLIFLNSAVNIRCNHYERICFFLPGCLLSLFGYLGLAHKIESLDYYSIRWFKWLMEYIGRNSIVFLVLNEVVIFTSGLLLRQLGFDTYFEQFNLEALGIAVFRLVLTIMGLMLATEVLNKKQLRILFGKKI